LSAKLPVVSATDVIKALAKMGYVFARQRGSHIILVNRQTRKIAVVPNRRQIPKGTLRAIIREADLTVEEFTKLL
jgi:predicted RNA binding protein YcfA (HicA-like mRNA interferase family)